MLRREEGQPIVLNGESLKHVTAPIVGPSTLGPQSGLGCFAAQAMESGSLVAFYPGVSIGRGLAPTMLQFLSPCNGYLISRTDGVLVDADLATESSRALMRSALGKEGMEMLSSARGAAVGHRVNHSRANANVKAVDVTYDRGECGDFVFVSLFGSPSTTLIPGIALYASRTIQEGEEFFLDYAFTSDPSCWPDWYKKST